jgi:hypothetical protein
MKCRCNSTEIRRAIGGYRCRCRQLLTNEQVIDRLVKRLDELDEANSHMIQGLVAAGLWECQLCGDWHKEAEVIHARDRATCLHCFQWEFFVREDDDDETIEWVMPEFIHALHTKGKMGLLPHDKKGVLIEPFLKAYADYSRAAL